MRVLSCFLDNRFGGAHKRACEVATRLRCDNVETIFLFNDKPTNSLPVNGFKNYRMRHIQILSKHKTGSALLKFLFLLPRNVRSLVRIIETEKVDIVYVFGLMNVLPVVAGKLARKKVIWDLNDTLCPALLRIPILALMPLCSDKTVVGARKVGEFHYGPSGRAWNQVEIVYAPVNMVTFNREQVSCQKVDRLRDEFGISKQDVVVGSIGNINPAKGYEYFVQAAAKIASSVSAAKFVVVGAALETQPRYFQKVQELIEQRGLKDKFIFTGFRDEIPEILCMFHVFVLSSVAEACPMVVPEAMAMEVPVVATNVGGVSEQVLDGETGHIVEPRNPEALAAGVLEVLQKPEAELEQMLEKARQRAQAIFSVHTVAAQQKSIYNEVLAMSKSSGRRTI